MGTEADALDLQAVLSYVRYELAYILANCTTFIKMKERTMLLLSYIESRELSLNEESKTEPDSYQNDDDCMVKREITEDGNTIDTEYSADGLGADSAESVDNAENGEEQDFHHMEWSTENPDPESTEHEGNGEADATVEEPLEENVSTQEQETENPETLQEEPENPPPKIQANKCNLCDKAFQTKSGLQKHKQVHSSRPGYTCPWCNKNFKRKEDFKLHVVKKGHITAGKLKDVPGFWGEEELSKYIEKLLTCKFCDQVFDKPSTYSMHMQVHLKDEMEDLDFTWTGPQTFTCNICDKVFQSRSGLNRHKKLHFDHPAYICSWCNKDFKRRDDLKLHLVREGHINTTDKNKDVAGLLGEDEMNKYIEKLLTCEFCDKIFDRQSTYKKHLQVHIHDMPTEEQDQAAGTSKNREGMDTIPGSGALETPWKSLVDVSCNFHNYEQTLEGAGKSDGMGMGQPTDKAIADLILKYSESANPDKIRPYTCPYCPFSTYQPGRLKEHERRHTGERPFSCDKCSKSFTLERSLKQHQKLHSGEKPHQCKECGKRFVTKSQLVTHEFTHTGISKFKCHTCPSSFSSKTGLDRHLNFHMGKRDHICDKCGKAFFAKSELTGHIRFHHKKRVYKFKCEICDKPFIARGDLNKHMTVHSDQRPYMCASCGKGFSRKTYLNKHMITHTNEKPYKCKTCNKAFSFVSNLVTHERVHTGEKPYSCQVCGKRSADVANHIKHMKIHNKDSRPPPVNTFPTPPSRPYFPEDPYDPFFRQHYTM